MADVELEAQVDALEDGRGSVDRSEDRLLSVAGADARTWLGDLVTGRLAGLEVGEARRSLLLTPTGRIRADFMVSTVPDGSFLISQAANQTEAVQGILAPYVLSSAVILGQVGPTRVRWFPGQGRLAIADDPGPQGALQVDERAFEVWRVRRGIPRMGIDFPAGSLPAESGLEEAIDDQKGCFLGQESVAKVRNLGHPPTVLRHLRSDEQLTPGAPIHTGDHPVGEVTSAAPARGGGWVLLARVVWAAAQTDLISTEGRPLPSIQD